MGFEFAGIYTGRPFQTSSGGSSLCYTVSYDTETYPTTNSAGSSYTSTYVLTRTANPSISISGDAEMAPLTFSLDPEYVLLDVNVSEWQGDSFGDASLPPLSNPSTHPPSPSLTPSTGPTRLHRLPRRPAIHHQKMALHVQLLPRRLRRPAHRPHPRRRAHQHPQLHHHRRWQRSGRITLARTAAGSQLGLAVACAHAAPFESANACASTSTSTEALACARARSAAGQLACAGVLAASGKLSCARPGKLSCASACSLCGARPGSSPFSGSRACTFS